MASRHYTVGLPVTIRVTDDGHVDYEIDTSEASMEMYEYDLSLLAEEMECSDNDTLEAQMEADRVHVDAEHSRNYASPTIRLSAEAWRYVRDLIQVDNFDNCLPHVAEELGWAFDTHEED